MGETQNPNSFKLDTGIKGSVFSLSQGDCDVFLQPLSSRDLVVNSPLWQLQISP